MELELPLGLAIAGRVVDPRGSPVADVLVSIVPEEGTNQRRTGRWTDVAGTFRVAGLQEGSYRIEAKPADGRALLSAVRQGVRAGTSDLELVLPEGAVVSGRVLDAGGSAVLHAAVRALDPAGEEVARAYTTADGSFALALEPGTVVDLAATPPSVNAPFEDFSAVDPALGSRLEGIAAGTGDLVLRLPATD